MIKLTKEDLKFKKSAEYRDRKENILNAANILGMINSSGIKYHLNPDKQRNLIEIVVSFMGLGNSSYGLSDYVCNRICMFEREQKTNEEISDWLRRMAK
ncbi:hypothetical protein [Nitrososphaera sp. AFS]|uniref:hypothetical protein n=1 Tax=Nitrososphaera sp. AFS TaxID=2301191 RepID=UPI00139221C1|nr:hypothetical protein [Nitrososphaera sp. AFS]NAL78941.1 hypothetical protein [Nitrososphaera sp. AFS]